MEVTDTVGYTVAKRLWDANVIRALLDTYPIPVPEYSYPASRRLYSLHINRTIIVRGTARMGADIDALMYLWGKSSVPAYPVYGNELLGTATERDNWVRFNGSVTT